MKLSLRMKIFIVIFVLVAAGVISFVFLGSFQFSRFEKLIYDSNMAQDEIISQTTDSMMFETTVENLQKFVKMDAQRIDWEFRDMRDDLELLAVDVEDIIEHPENYMEREIKEPDRHDEGTPVCQLLYSHRADREDQQAASKIKKLANLCRDMKYIVMEKEVMHEVVLAIPEGLSIVTDRHPEDKIGSNGKVIAYDADTEPFYIEAVKEKKAVFSPLNFDEHHGHYKVSVGVPVYINGEFAALIGGSRFLSDMDDMVTEMSRDIGEDSFICVVSDDGDIIYSEKEEGELFFDGRGENNILDQPDHELAALGQKAVNGETGFGLINLDGEETYLAYAPLETVGWTMLVGVSKETLRQPSKELVAHVDEITYETMDRTKKMSDNLKGALLLIAAGLIFLSVFTSLRYSRKLVRPIRVLKNAGIRFIEREDIGLKYTQDFFGDLNLYTGDETEDLWLTMRDLEQNFRTSMQKLEGITAEKERIDTELSIAARLQSSMLPKVFNDVFALANELDPKWAKENFNRMNLCAHHGDKSSQFKNINDFLNAEHKLIIDNKCIENSAAQKNKSWYKGGKVKNVKLSDLENQAGMGKNQGSKAKRPNQKNAVKKGPSKML